MGRSDPPHTRISTYSSDDISIRGKSLITDLMGKVSFSEMIYFHVLGRMPTPGETTILDAVMVTLMEHGMTPSVIAARLTYLGAPESIQSAIAAGLLSVGDRFVGTMEGAARILADLVAAGADMPAEARKIAESYRGAGKRLPGFGHHLHRPDDPRTPRLLEIAIAQGVPGRHIAALHALAAAVDEAWGRHITINATGAIAAVLAEIGVPSEIMRGFAVVSRAAGLLGHLNEERDIPAAAHIWERADKEVPYNAEKIEPKED